jgi:hypothetical protein
MARKSPKLSSKGTIGGDWTDPSRIALHMGCLSPLRVTGRMQSVPVDRVPGLLGNLGFPWLSTPHSESALCFGLPSGSNTASRGAHLTVSSCPRSPGSIRLTTFASQPFQKGRQIDELGQKQKASLPFVDAGVHGVRAWAPVWSPGAIGGSTRGSIGYTHLAGESE